MGSFTHTARPSGTCDQTVSPLGRPLRFAQLSVPRQVLVRLCQATNFGSVLALEVRDREPVFDPAPEVLLHVRLDVDDVARPEADLSDFLLKDEVLRLLDLLDELITATIECLEIRAGIPRRVIFKMVFQEDFFKTSTLAVADHSAGGCDPHTRENANP